MEKILQLMMKNGEIITNKNHLVARCSRLKNYKINHFKIVYTLTQPPPSFSLYDLLSYEQKTFIVSYLH